MDGDSSGKSSRESADSEFKKPDRKMSKRKTSDESGSGETVIEKVSVNKTKLKPHERLMAGIRDLRDHCVQFAIKDVKLRDFLDEIEKNATDVMCENQRYKRRIDGLNMKRILAIERKQTIVV